MLSRLQISGKWLCDLTRTPSAAYPALVAQHLLYGILCLKCLPPGYIFDTTHPSHRIVPTPMEEWQGPPYLLRMDSNRNEGDLLWEESSNTLLSRVEGYPIEVTQGQPHQP